MAEVTLAEDYMAEVLHCKKLVLVCHKSFGTNTMQSLLKKIFNEKWNVSEFFAMGFISFSNFIGQRHIPNVCK